MTGFFNKIFPVGTTFFNLFFRFFCISVLVRISYFVFAFFVFSVNDHQKPQELFAMPDKDDFGVFSLFHKNDAAWYKVISEYGYIGIPVEEICHNVPGCKPQSPLAFFPAYPYLLRLGMYLTGLHFFWVAMIFSLLTSSLLFTIFFKLAFSFFTNSTKTISSTLLLLILPFHFYFSMFYTEALFLTALLFCFYSLIKNKWLLFSLAASVMVLTRPNGIFMLIPLVFFYFEKTNYSLNVFRKEYLSPFLAFLSPCFFFVGYLVCLKIVTGNFFAFNYAQLDWYKKATFPLFSLFNQGGINTQFNSVYTLLFMGIALVFYKKIKISFHLLIWINILLPMSAGSMLSLPRYISVMFPFVLLGGDFLSGKSYEKKVYWVILVFHFLSYYFWLMDNPIVV